MSWIKDKELRGYIGSWVFIVLVFSIITFLSFKEVPAANKDIVTTIIGMLVASLGVVVYTLIGKDESEVLELKKSNEILKEQNEQLKKRINHLENMFMDLQEKVISKLSIISEKQ